MKIIRDDELKKNLMSDLKLTDLPTDFELIFKSYSRSCYGRYYVKAKKIILYIEANTKGDYFSYDTLLDTLIHEAVHHYQHHYEKGYKRLDGVMHDLNFKKKHKECLDKLINLEVISDEYKPV